ncbi:hypothetical protein [Caballeronia sordidicola]|uniref:hypothetical protein n=1 Tax=Caballeronia sordidicola TaxID=196367 RepID=UPI00117753D8|nr:hypothetical protein [Caballeronia sordidicola]
MSYHPAGMRVTDTEYPVSTAAFNVLRDYSNAKRRILRSAARELLDRFITQAKYVDWDLSKLEFDNVDNPATGHFSMTIDLSDAQIIRLAKAGRFYPHEVLNVALCLVGPKS